jgi:hypothetical protein
LSSCQPVSEAGSARRAAALVASSVRARIHARRRTKRGSVCHARGFRRFLHALAAPVGIEQRRGSTQRGRPRLRASTSLRAGASVGRVPAPRAVRAKPWRVEPPRVARPSARSPRKRRAPPAPARAPTGGSGSAAHPSASPRRGAGRGPAVGLGRTLAPAPTDRARRARWKFALSRAAPLTTLERRRRGSVPPPPSVIRHRSDR